MHMFNINTRSYLSVLMEAPGKTEQVVWHWVSICWNVNNVEEILILQGERKKKKGRNVLSYYESK